MSIAVITYMLFTHTNLCRDVINITCDFFTYYTISLEAFEKDWDDEPFRYIGTDDYKLEDITKTIPVLRQKLDPCGFPNNIIEQIYYYENGTLVFGM